MAETDLNQRLDRIEAVLATLVAKNDLADLRAELRADFATKADLANLATKVDVAELSSRVGRQVAVTEALRSDIRFLTGIAQSTFAALQALIAGYADLSGRVTDLENPAPEA